MVQGNEPLLHIQSGTHFRCRTNQHTDFAAVHSDTEPFLFLVGIVIVDECDLVSRNTLGDQLFLPLGVARSQKINCVPLVGVLLSHVL